MSLLEKLHELWAADSTLDGLLDSDRLSTGNAVDPTLPYAVVTKAAEGALGSANDGSTVDDVEVMFRIYHADHDAGAAIVQALKSLFHRADFDLEAGPDAVLNMRRGTDTEAQAADGVWLFTVPFTCRVYLASGV